MADRAPVLVRGLAVLTAAMLVVLILVGGLVTTTRTGDTIPTWPFWRGALAGGAWVEWSHRAVAGVVGLLVLALAVALHWKEPRASVRRLGWLALAGVVVQALIGAVRIYLPAAAVAIVHAVFAQAVFCLLVTLAWRPAQGAADARGLGIAATAASFLQLVAGAVTRHTGAGLEIHVAGAVAVLLLVSLFASRLMLTPLRRGGLVLLGLLGLQIALGIATWVVTRNSFDRSVDAPVASLVTVSAHVATGAGLLASCLVLTLGCRRAPSAAPQAVLALRSGELATREGGAA
jgi:heme A synthase